MPEWSGDGDFAGSAARLTHLSEGRSKKLDRRRQALKDLEQDLGELRLRLITEPEDASEHCRQLLERLAATDEAVDLPLDPKWQRRRDALEMSLTNFLADSLVEIGDWPGAAQTYERCLSLGAQFQVPEFQAESLLKLGRAYRHARRLDEARLAFERADVLSALYGLFVTQAEALYQQAVVAELGAKLEEAFALYRQGLQLSEGQRLYGLSIRFLSQLGQLHQDEGQYPAALDYYRRCLRLLRETDDDQASETIILGQISHICTELNDFEAGLVVAQEGLSLSRQTGQKAEEAAFLADLVQLYRRQGDNEKARAVAEELVAQASASGDPDRLAEARRVLEHLSEPGDLAQDEAALNITRYYRQGNRHYGNRAFERAISAYNRALTLDPGHAGALINRGSAYAAKGHYDRALADYCRAIERDSTDSVAYFNRANSYRKRRQYYLAVEDYSEAIRLAPADPDAYFNRGEVLRRLKRLDDAARDFQTVLDLSQGRDEPGAEQARQLLAQLTASTKD